MKLVVGRTERVPARATRPLSGAPELRQVLPWGLVVMIAALAWVLTVRQAEGMGIGPGTMGLTFPLFLWMWVAMMAAMMLPSVAPVAILWSRSIVRSTQGVGRLQRMSSFVAGYMLAWTAVGALAFAGLLGVQRLVDASPDGGQWLGVSIFVLAGIYQLTPFKSACLRHCRSPMMQLLRYASYRGRARDMRVGLHHGLYCVGCCWGLMIVLGALGVMNVAAMAGLAVVIFLEKLWRHGERLARVIGVGFVVAAAVAAFQPAALPALNSHATNAMSMTRGGAMHEAGMTP